MKPSTSGLAMATALVLLLLPLSAPEANAAAHARISRMGSRTSAWVIATDEERMIAEHTLAALRG